MNKFLFLLIVPLFIFASCINEDMVFDIGKNKVDIKTHMVFVDTVSVESYTVMFDSIATSGLENPSIMVGRYNDSEFGTVTSSTFFKFKTISVSGSTIPDDAVFDSLKLFLKYNSYSIGDTMAPFKLNVHRLKEFLEPNDDNYFYNNDSIEAYNTVFGSTTFQPYPHSSDDTVWVKLDPDFGMELFNMIEDNDDIIKDNDRFTEYLKGFMVHYDVTNKAILGFRYPAAENDTASPGMRLYFHYTDQTVIYTSLDFMVQPYDYEFYQKKLLFNRIDLKNARFPLPASQREKIPASATNNKTFLMAGVGIMTRFEIPHLKNLMTLHENIQVVDAILEIEPANNTYLTIDLPENISLYETDKLNTFGDEISDKFGETQSPVLNIDELYQEDTYYRFDVTQFVQDKLFLATDQVPALLMTISGENFNKTVQRMVSGSRLNSRDRVKLKIYYITIE